MVVEIFVLRQDAIEFFAFLRIDATETISDCLDLVAFSRQAEAAGHSP